METITSNPLSIDNLADIFDERSKAANGFNMPDTIPISYWGMALMGEGGELCNLLAKLERVKAGAVDGGNSLKVTEISKEKLAEEIGGIFIYLAILSKRLGISLEEAIVKTFNEKSEKIGYPVKLALAKVGFQNNLKNSPSLDYVREKDLTVRNTEDEFKGVVDPESLDNTVNY